MSAYVPSERLHVLVDSFCTDAIGRAELQELDALLRSDPEARRYHAEYCRMHAELMFTLCAERAVRAVQATEPQVATPVPLLIVPETSYRGFLGNLSDSWSLAYLLGAVIFAAGLWVGSLFTVTHYTQIADRASHQAPSRPSVAADVDAPAKVASVATVGRITGMLDCRWEEIGDRARGAEVKGRGTGKAAGEAERTAGRFRIPSLESPVALGDKFALSSGLLEISYDNGARVILQGPVRYEVESAEGGFLAIGKLTAKLEKRGEGRGESKGSGVRGQGSEKVASKEGSGLRGQGAGKVVSETNPEIPKSQIPNPLSSSAPMFAVRTPTATVTDLGTEFGVEVSKEGYTTSHVFRGSVRVQINGQAEARVLRANETVRVEKDHKDPSSKLVLVSASPAEWSNYVRRIPKQVTKYLDLVDVVAGGNGFMGRRNAAINPTSGDLANRPPENLGFVSDGQYHRVASLPMVDGVFIPQGKQTVTQIDSAGHTFSDFGNSSDATSDYVWAIGVLPSTPEYGPLRRVPYKVGDVNYGAKGHGALFLHANKGITFDLDAVRRAYPGAKLRKFLANAGSTFGEGDGNGMPGDIRVFVDGKVQLQRRDVNVVSGSIPISIPLRDGNRHLTLTATEGGRGIGAVWIVFGDPRIEMSCMDTSILSDQKGGSGDKQ